MGDQYRIEFTDSARNDLERLDRQTAQRILKKLAWLAEHADKYPHQALTGKWAGYFKFRVGDYRVIYSLSHQVLLIVVIRIRHRREVYDE